MNNQHGVFSESANSQSQSDSGSFFYKKVFLKLLQQLRHGQLELITPNKEHLYFGDTHSQDVAVLQINDWRACQKILQAGDIGFAEAYQQAWIDTPNLKLLLSLALKNEAQLNRLIFGGSLMKYWYRVKHFFRRNTKQGSRKNIFAHYDIGNDFYKLWLDPSWTYSSALFDGNFQLSLEQAQAAKYQRIIDQLSLKAGDRVLEIGCGWGGFAEQAAKQGIYVDGITISQSQLNYAQQRIQKQGLQDLVNLRICDYRDLEQTYDAIVSIEMFEAVGETFWDAYFEVVAKCLRPQGKALIQTITIADDRFEAYRSTSDFIQEFIFPGGMLPSPSRFKDIANTHQLQCIDAYSFGLDYAETLKRWDSDFQEQRTRITELGLDLPFQRIWELYFAYCQVGFLEERTDVIQFTLQK
jgi:cyclopropane-fatty-acyl-phospholipid synthase